MIYFEYKPAASLSPWVEKLWYCKAQEFTTSVLTIPILHHELVFNFSENFSLTKISTGDHTIKNPKAWMSGLQTKAYYSHSQGYHEMAGVLFKTNGLSSFLKCNARELSNLFIEPEYIFGSPFKLLYDRVENTKAPAEKIKLIEAFLIKNMNPLPIPSYLIFSMDQFARYRGDKGGVQEICKGLSISNKTLIASYNKYVGINPLKFAHLRNITKALHLIATDPRQSLTKLAYELGFYDQSHFISRFKSITSFTPSEYALLLAEGRIDKLSPNYITKAG